MSKTLTAEYVGSTRLARDVREFLFRPVDPPLFHFRAGQYLTIEIPAEDDAPPLCRSYSIASSPVATETFSIVANLVPTGRGSPFLFGLRPGTLITFGGPQGDFVIDLRGDRDYLFVATGTGIAPLRAMMYALFDAHIARTIQLFWGLRNQEEIYFQDEFAAWAARHPHFAYGVTLSRPGPGWHGATGYVTRLVEERVASVEGLDIYLCGHGAMIEAVKTVVRPKGLCPIHTEQYY
ncbi:MAG: hypothetical protein HYV02_02720 [Deltaproteobacteria bacterium]|nr:hypothetical protein [Deltaproteobacteria bacterium]